MSLSGPPTPLKHYLQFSDLNADDYAYLFARAALIKKKFKTYEKHQPLIDRTLVMIFEKASTRTRVSFEAGMYQLGGTVVNQDRALCRAFAGTGHQRPDQRISPVPNFGRHLHLHRTPGLH